MPLHSLRPQIKHLRTQVTPMLIGRECLPLSERFKSDNFIGAQFDPKLDHLILSIL